MSKVINPMEIGIMAFALIVGWQVMKTSEKITTLQMEHAKEVQHLQTQIDTLRSDSNKFYGESFLGLYRSTRDAYRNLRRHERWMQYVCRNLKMGYPPDNFPMVWGDLPYASEPTGADPAQFFEAKMYGFPALHKKSEDGKTPLSWFLVKEPPQVEVDRNQENNTKEE